MELKTDIEQLADRLEEARIDLKNAKSAEERIAISNYMDNLSESIRGLTGLDFYPSKKAIYGSNKNYHKFFKKFNIYEDRMIMNYLKNKKYHHDYLGTMLDAIDDLLTPYSELDYKEGKKLTKEDFFMVFYDFLKSLNLDKKYNEFIKDTGIYSYLMENTDGYNGYILFNPKSRKTDIFIGDFDYDVDTLYTLAHEVGHTYDFSKFDGDFDTYNKYFYQSFYGEAVSKLFERLLVEYLIKNNILVGDSKEALIGMEFENYTNMIFSYMISLFDDEKLKKHKQEHMSSDAIYALVSDDFEEGISDILTFQKSMSIYDSYIYTYGDIISMFLKKEVNKYGFDNDMLFDLFNRRAEVFSIEFLDKYKMTVNKYLEEYEKELKLVKKL